MIRLLAALGALVLAGLAALGRFARFTADTLSHLVRPPYYPGELWHAVLSVGFFSLPVVGLTALFTGGALALQIYSGGSRFNAEAVVPQIVAIGMVRELGPVLVGLMIAARVTSSIAAEIATMKVTEQLDALVTLSTHPMKYLTLPRVLAGTLVMPVLVAVGDVIGIMGGYIVGTQRLGFNGATYLQNTVDFLEGRDIVSSLTKGAVFGFIAALLGCYYGMQSERGAAGVGRATKGAVVAAAVTDPRRQPDPDRGVLHLMITLIDLHKTFGANAVLRGVNLTVAKGQSLVVIGGSGTGKSVLIKCILGLVTPDRGTITVDGQDVTRQPHDAFLARFGMLFQGAALFDSLPVWQNVAFRLLRGPGRLPKAQAHAVALEKLRRVGLSPDVGARYPAELSGGMQKRVGLARAIAADPQIIFLRRTHHRAGPDHGRRHQRPDPRNRDRDGRHRDHHHA